MPTLETAAHPSITLADALRDAFPEPDREATVALLYTPTRCRVAKLAAGHELRGESGAALTLEGVYEARVFSERCELRWLMGDGDKGQAALLGAAPGDGREGWARRGEEYLAELSQTYLLWGKARDAEGGWTRLVSNRIGSLAVPVEAAAEQRVVLEVIEYTRAFEHGNVAVFEERLVRLAAAGEAKDG